MAGLALLRGDLSRMSRGTRAHAVRLVFVGVLAVFTAIAWPWDAQPGRTISGEPLLRVFVWCEILAAAFLVPAFVAPAVASEREQGTLDILVACPHTEGNLVFGRGLSQGAWALSLLAAGAPFAVIAVVIGGAPPWRAVVGLLHALFAGLFSVIVSLAASLRAKTVAEATTSAFVWMLGTIGVGFVVSYAGLALAGGREGWEWILGFFLVGAVLLVVGIRFRVHLASAIGAILFGLAGLTSWFAVSVPFFGGTRVPRGTVDRVLAGLCPWVSSLTDLSGHPLPDDVRFITWGSYLAFSAVALFFVVRHVKRHGLLVNPDPLMAAFRGWNARPEHRPGPAAGPAKGGVALPRAVVVQHRMAMAGADDALWKARKQRGSALPVRGNPVQWKDSKILKNPASGCLIALTVAVCGLLTLPTILGCAEGRTHSGLVHTTVLVDFVFLGLLVASLCGSLFASERAGRTLPVLLSTGFPPGEVVKGKLLAVVWHLRAPLVLTSLRLFMMLVDALPQGAIVLVIFVTGLAGLAGLSTAISAFVPSSRASAGLAVLAGFAIWVGPSIIGAEILSPFEFVPLILRWTARRSAEASGIAALWCLCHAGLAVAGCVLASHTVERGASA